MDLIWSLRWFQFFFVKNKRNTASPFLSSAEFDRPGAALLLQAPPRLSQPPHSLSSCLLFSHLPNYGLRHFLSGCTPWKRKCVLFNSEIFSISSPGFLFAPRIFLFIKPALTSPPGGKRTRAGALSNQIGRASCRERV